MVDAVYGVWNSSDGMGAGPHHVKKTVTFDSVRAAESQRRGPFSSEVASARGRVADQARTRASSAVSDTTAVAAPDAAVAGAGGLALQHGESLSVKSLATHVEAAQDLPVSATTSRGRRGP